VGVGGVWGHLAKDGTDAGQRTSATDTRVGFLGVGVTGRGVRSAHGHVSQPGIVAMEGKL